MEQGPASVQAPAVEVAQITPERTVVTTARMDLDVPIENEGRKNAVVNPLVAVAPQSPKTTAGCSTMVTPIPHYLPRIVDVQWIVGAFQVVRALLDPDDSDKVRSERVVTNVEQKIDMGDYLPTSYDDMAEWRTVMGSTARAARI